MHKALITNSSPKTGDKDKSPSLLGLKQIRFQNFLVLMLFVLVVSACEPKPKVLYQSPEFTVYADRVVQGEFTAKVESPTRIVSDYRSLAHENYSRLVKFKFSINEKDNEKKSGNDHWVIIEDDAQQSPVIVFGSVGEPMPDEPKTKLPVNHSYTFRLDMNPVLKQFAEKGYYETFDGTRIAQSDFKAVYIAGGSEPLTWDFVNLEEEGLSMKDPDNDGIYEITLLMNPYDEKKALTNTWTLTQDVSMKPSYTSDQPLVDALFNLSLEEARLNIEADSTLRTGAKWGGVWTRDVSYSTVLAFAVHEPQVAKISLMKKVKNGRIIQDTGSGGAWPVSSDRTTWVLAAWEIFKVTGDEDWLKTAFEIIKNTLADDEKTLPSSLTQMNRGESSFLDWREQTYPKWMSNMDIFQSENLGTNVVHYQANIILNEMAQRLGQPSEAYLHRANEIKSGINNFLWMKDKGYYGQYLYGRTAMMLSPRFEALGEALSILFEVADEQQSKSILENSPLVNFGATCIYPQIPNIPPYHNNGIWPFVQSFWNLAAAKAGNETALVHGLAAIYRPTALFLSNYENFVADNGDYVGTEINSHRMLWSMAGNLAMVYRVFSGIHFEPDGISFQPVIPEVYGGNRSLSNFRYRNAILTIHIKGFGNQISSFKLDGQPSKNAFFPANLEGAHTIEIVMNSTPFKPSKINLVPNRFSLANPITQLDQNTISWEAVPQAETYHVYKNGVFEKAVDELHVEVNPDEVAEYAVTAVDSDGVESFTSEPILILKDKDLNTIEFERFVPMSVLPYSNFSGKGFVEISTTKNTEIQIQIDVAESGNYWIDSRYANGTGPWNTDNNCAIRSIYLNGSYWGVWVFPQRGTDEWSDWGYSNAILFPLNKGKNELKIKLESWNTNMDGEINEALLDFVRVVRRKR